MQIPATTPHLRTPSFFYIGFFVYGDSSKTLVEPSPGEGNMGEEEQFKQAIFVAWSQISQGTRCHDQIFQSKNFHFPNLLPYGLPG
jgi:hypothetical protein